MSASMCEASRYFLLPWSSLRWWQKCGDELFTATTERERETETDRQTDRQTEHGQLYHDTRVGGGGGRHRDIDHGYTRISTMICLREEGENPKGRDRLYHDLSARKVYVCVWARWEGGWGGGGGSVVHSFVSSSS